MEVLTPNGESQCVCVCDYMRAYVDAESSFNVGTHLTSFSISSQYQFQVKRDLRRQLEWCDRSQATEPADRFSKNKNATLEHAKIA